MNDQQTFQCNDQVQISHETMSSSRCLTNRQMLLSSNSFERTVFGSICPIFIVLGSLGNAINLTVLLSPVMRNRSWMLSYLAITDIFFLLFMLPHSLANYEAFALDMTFRSIYVRYKVHLLALSNWASAAAIWLVLVICVERLIGIRYPLLAKKYSTIGDKRCQLTSITCIVFLTGLLTCYTHFSYVTKSRLFCNGTQLHALDVAVDAPIWPRNRTNPSPIWLRNYVVWSKRIHEFLVVFIPTTAIIFANIMLFITLKRRSKFIASFDGKRSSTDTNGRHSHSRTEHKIAITICAIVTCFTVTQAPSGIVSTTIGLIQYGGPRWKHNLLVITNGMVVVGKSLNFALFCLSSETFRNRLIMLIKERFIDEKERSGLHIIRKRYYTNNNNCKEFQPILSH
ncbi:hypothetical protein AB6A40_002469 [Gnathostoma spinigerum]|uniref:G-protein coupled receptors family 1 profile domain-containing protein n=1 Tax=Gnathostoma spinigerum TaxID=75299 RepID=A0ABD6E7U8_9BILA